MHVDFVTHLHHIQNRKGKKKENFFVFNIHFFPQAITLFSWLYLYCYFIVY